ncbi:hypothetical protein V8C86DRAFT_2516612 [Haematococcus lacustris]
MGGWRLAAGCRRARRAVCLLLNMRLVPLPALWPCLLLCMACALPGAVAGRGQQGHVGQVARPLLKHLLLLPLP